ncbi:MAG: YeeE/YedE family protein [Lentisphaeria bacterium]|nr:YeeE/YedE family protein [Lentisphaeria bacterium]MBR7128271.1 YeeE/YedE family protein [Lentisphaeria bacterium]
MRPLDLSSTAEVGVAIAIGFVIGFALLKSDLIWRKSVHDILTLKDGRLVKTVLFILGFGALLFYFCERNNLVNIHVSISYLWASIIGGIISGIGLVICGFTPISAVANFFTGRVYTIWTILGMILALPIVKIFDDKFLSNFYVSEGQMNLPVTNSNQGGFLAEGLSDNRFLSFSNGALIAFIVCFLLIVVVQFTIGDSTEKD